MTITVQASNSPKGSSVSRSLTRNLTEESQLTSVAGNVDGNDLDNDHEFKTAPLLTRGAYRTKKMRQAIGQYGVFGNITESRLPQAMSMQDDEFSRLYLNTNTPFSALVCGVQGSGKSHTVSVILENMFVTGCPALGQLVKPLSGLILHVGETGSCSAPCEAAYVGVSTVNNAMPPTVVVYVAPSSLKRMRQVYSRLGKNVEVKPLYFSPSELDAAAFLSLMAVNSSDHAPLYMQTVLSILRELGDDYTYTAFMARIEEQKKDMNPAQKAGLKQRLDLLMTFTQPAGKPKSPSKARNISTVEEQRFASGRVTIIDLSDPFVDSAMAGAIFEICIRLFQRANVDTGKVLVVDEAHKYLSDASTPTGLTRALLSLVRQQRHMSMRVIVSTQEPTVLPSAFIALCSLIILHRFASSAWWEHLKKHIPATMSSDDSFDRVVTLKTGEALVCCPTGVYVGTEPGSGSEGVKIKLLRFSRNFLVVRTRRRVTADGGVSLMAI
ncbi:hypothetical protein EDB89DRAFT_730085 [Lactarius sanguifluus]|nr:hypothetical protein EDB89DRAFT_730085 [Lactarius sanguifluus]